MKKQVYKNPQRSQHSLSTDSIKVSFTHTRIYLVSVPARPWEPECSGKMPNWTESFMIPCR